MIGINVLLFMLKIDITYNCMCHLLCQALLFMLASIYFHDFVYHLVVACYNFMHKTMAISRHFMSPRCHGL
jgi:hypothetical protein